MRLAVASRRYAVFGALVLALVLSESVSFALRQAIGRDRPTDRFVEPAPLISAPHSHSFPSGHATSAFAAAIVLGSAFPRLRWALLALAAAIAWSRVVVGVHYPLDVLGGAVLGTAIGVLTLRALRLLGRARPRSHPPPRSG